MGQSRKCNLIGPYDWVLPRWEAWSWEMEASGANTRRGNWPGVQSGVSGVGNGLISRWWESGCGCDGVVHWF